MLAQNRRWALDIACQRLALHPADFAALVPTELALMLRGERKRRNFDLAVRAYHTAWLLAPHLSRRDRTKASVRRILMGSPGFNPDPEDIVG